jgi:ElaB/YqjD/DUF883 family membrane-anchored ribosome-binding protein
MRNALHRIKINAQLYRDCYVSVGVGIGIGLTVGILLAKR